MKKWIAAMLLTCLVLCQFALAEVTLYETRANGQLMREEYRDENGNLAIGEQGFAAHRMEYDAQGNAILESYYDENNELMANAEGIMTITREYDDQGRAILERYFGADGEGMFYEPIDAYGRRIGYDEDGKENRIILLDAEGNRMNGSDGWCEHTIVFDGKRKIQERYLDADGRPALYKGNYSGIDRVYNEKGKVIRETFYDITGNVGPNKSGVIIDEKDYDENGKTSEIRYYDASGEPVQVSSGAYRICYVYDENGNANNEILLDADGNRINGVNGWCEHSTTYDENKNKIAEFYLDADGRPALYKDSYSGIERVYNEAGLVVRETFYDLSGEIGPNEDGVIIDEKEYDENGKVHLIRYFDASNQPMLMESIGAYALEREYDEAGNTILAARRDGNGALMVGKDGWAVATYVFDEQKHKLSEQYYGADRRPITMDKGYAAITREYNENGDVILETYTDSDGKLVKRVITEYPEN